METIRTRLREVAFLNKTATISFNVTGAPSSSGNGASAGAETFHFSGGISEFVAWNNRARIPMHDPIYVSRTVGCLPNPANLISHGSRPAMAVCCFEAAEQSASRPRD